MCSASTGCSPRYSARLGVWTYFCRTHAGADGRHALVCAQCNNCSNSGLLYVLSRCRAAAAERGLAHQQDALLCNQLLLGAV